MYIDCLHIYTCIYTHVYEKIRWTRAKRHTADSCLELVGSHQHSPAQFTLGSTQVYIHVHMYIPDATKETGIVSRYNSVNRRR